ncbi:MAG: hypothetical protein ACE5ET_05750 [Gammaproteobacteria bacterium]
MNPEILLRHKVLNWLQSLLMLGGMAGVLALLGWFLGGVGPMIWTIVLTLVLFLITPQFSSRIVLRLYGARPLTPWKCPISMPCW